MSTKKLIKEYKIDDTLDLEKIIKEYRSYIYKIIVNMTFQKLSKEDIEEIISDTFFIVWKNYQKLDDEKPISSYLAGITKNLVKEKQRGKKVSQALEELKYEVQDIRPLDMIYEEREKIAMLENILKTMKKDEIEIFKFYYYEGKSNREISKMFNISEFGVKSKLYRIRKKLKKELEKGGYRDESERK